MNGSGRGRAVNSGKMQHTVALATYAISLLIFNGALIFFFWNFGRRNKTASDSPATKTVSSQ